MTNKEIEKFRDFNYNLVPQENRIKEKAARVMYQATKIPYVPRKGDA